MVVMSAWRLWQVISAAICVTYDQNIGYDT